MRIRKTQKDSAMCKGGNLGPKIPAAQALTRLK